MPSKTAPTVQTRRDGRKKRPSRARAASRSFWEGWPQGPGGGATVIALIPNTVGGDSTCPPFSRNRIAFKEERLTD
jgi:hypothetical protein